MTLSYTHAAGYVTVSDPTVNNDVEIGLGDNADSHAMSGDAEFDRPVDETLAVETDRLTFTRDAQLIIRDADTTEIVDEFKRGTDGQVAAGDYVCEIVGLPVKIYIDVPSDTELSVLDRPVDPEGADGPGRIELAFPSLVRVQLGLRSLNQRADGVIVTPPEEDQIFESVAYLCGAIQESGPERSFPTLRDHPPRVELGDEFRVDADVTRPETGIVLYTPRSLSVLYSVAPLAYYLKADIQPVDEAVPVLEAGDRSVALGSPHPDADTSVRAGEVADAVLEVLQHVFLLDCVVRDAGWTYDKPEVAETAAIKETLSDEGIELDVEALYEQPLVDRTARYLTVPIGVVNDVYEWEAVADVRPNFENVVDLPARLRGLEHIRSPTQSHVGDDDAAEELRERFFETDDRDDRGIVMRGGVDSIGSDVSSTTDQETPVSPSEPSVDAGGEIEGATVSPAPGSHQQHVAVEPDYPIWSAKPAVASQATLDRTATGTTVDAHVVANLAVERDLETVYDQVPMDVDEVEVETDVTTARLREIIEDGCSFLHVASHVAEDGIQCSDGVLDVDDLEESNVDLFMLNGCSSYLQGEALIEQGSFAGVVSTDDVLSREAFRFGANCLGLLGRGFSVGAALTAIRAELNGPPRYLVLGDWQATLRSQGTEPTLAVVDGPGVEPGEVSFRVIGYAGWQWGIGSIYESRLLGDTDVPHSGYWLGPGEAGSFSCGVGAFTRHLAQEDGVVVDATLYTDETPVGAFGDTASSLEAALEKVARR